MTLTTLIRTAEIKLISAEKMHTTRAVCKTIFLKLKVQAEANDCSAQSFRLFMKL
jgi:hypothetical protein